MCFVMLYHHYYFHYLYLLLNGRAQNTGVPQRPPHLWNRTTLPDSPEGSRAGYLGYWTTHGEGVGGLEVGMGYGWACNTPIAGGGWGGSWSWGWGWGWSWG